MFDDPCANALKYVAIADLIRSLYQDQNLTTDKLNQAIIDNVFAVTMKFESTELQGPHNDPATYLSKYRSWFHWLMIQSFGNNLGRKKHLQPMSYAFLDFSNSRGSRSESSVDEIMKSGLLHIHAVIALRPGAGQACRMPLMVAGSAHQLRRFGDVKVEQYQAERGSLENMIQYFMKGAERIGSRLRSDAYEVLPR